MRYTVEHLIPEDQYSDKWETVMIAKLIREDGNTGDVWIVAGVPRQYHQTATIVRHEHGLRSVRVYGDSPDCWCPASFDPDDVDDIIAACREAALAKDEEMRQERGR